MKIITNQTFDEERALYGAENLIVKNCAFDGLADGESAFKESRNVQVNHCFFNLRYPFWHDSGLKIENSEMTELCRAALWYSDHVEIHDSKLHGIKALRECSNIKIYGCDIISPEFGWSVHGLEMEDCQAESEYFMMRSDNLVFKNVQFKGKYSFQYIENSIFENCTFDTKDAFWHGKNIVVKNSLIKGEYCKNLKLIDCEMIDTDLSFERSEVEATLTAPILSIKNPLSGHIYVPAVGEIIRDIADTKGEILIKEQCLCA